ncbi:hypothetical protein, partial [Streptosporangium sandarakinum]|uniref:hypothetical protein n=1 Tax=Streptosporangium sandarakinum TaxID=1260955 RepID=UPI0033A705AB
MDTVASAANPACEKLPPRPGAARLEPRARERSREGPAGADRPSSPGRYGTAADGYGAAAYGYGTAPDATPAPAPAQGDAARDAPERPGPGTHGGAVSPCRAV